MNDDKWQDILLKVKEKFTIEDQTTAEDPDIERSKIETVIFNSPIGRIKMVRTTTPRVLDKKTVYSRRAGSDMAVQYDYSDTEFVQNLKIFKWDDLQEDWVKASLDL